jgi:hypothetical protein
VSNLRNSCLFKPLAKSNTLNTLILTSEAEADTAN